LGKLQGLRKDIQRITVALEKLVGIEGKDSNKKQISWLESEGEETEIQEDKEKGKQKEERLDREDEKEEQEVRGQEEENGMESMEEEDGSFSLVTYFVRTGV